jgi:hypothetical protein
MLKVDAIDLYDLSEAGRLLFRDPARLAREARLRKIPSTRVGGVLALPAPWVDAESGKVPVDAESLRDYWLTRLAPPSPDGHRAKRERDRLPEVTLIGRAEAARRLFVDAKGLVRLATDQTVPAVRVDGEPMYDEALVDLVARASGGEELSAELEARQTLVLAWARFDYVTEVELPTNRVAEILPDEPAAPPPTPAPGAFEIPADLGLDEIAPMEDAPSTLADADGFRTVDED